MYNETIIRLLKTKLMRIKSFYSSNEITIDLYTTGSEWMTSDNNEYIGLYHKYTTGEVYTQPKWDKNKSVKLIKYIELNQDSKTYKIITNVKLNYSSFKTHNVNINKEDIDIGYINRYIFKKINENKFYEVDNETHDMYSQNKIDPNIYVAKKIQWYITGEISDTQNGLITIQGARSKNIDTIKQAELTMPNLSLYLSNPLQYYTDTDVIIPTDINGLDS